MSKNKKKRLYTITQTKKFCKNKFATWHSAEVQKQVDSGINFEDVDVDLKLSVLKPCHAIWLVELYNFFTSTEGKVYVLKRWEKAGKNLRICFQWKRSATACSSVSRHLLLIKLFDQIQGHVK